MNKAQSKPFLWKHPRGYWYVRLGGRYHRITAQEGTPDFDRQYWEAVSGKQVTGRRDLKALITSYRNSDRWSGLSPRSRADYEKILAFLEEAIGTTEVPAIRRTDIIALMQDNSYRVRFANYIQQVMSILLEHGLDVGWVDQNPAKGVRKLRMPSERKQPHVPWPDFAVDRFRREAGSFERLIFEIGIGSVQRPGDWPRIRWDDYDGDSLRITQGKTGRTLWLPCTFELRDALERAPRNGLTVLAKRDGQPLSYRYMAQIMRLERQRLGLVEYDLHALSYRGVMELARANCTDDEIAAFSGHASLAMIQKYAGAARQEMRARTAAQKRG